MIDAEIIKFDGKRIGRITKSGRYKWMPAPKFMVDPVAYIKEHSKPTKKRKDKNESSKSKNIETDA
jgi:hypothetical protein